MSDELLAEQHRANRLADQVESLRGQNNTLTATVHEQRAAHKTACILLSDTRQQRDQLRIAARNLPRNPGKMTAGPWNDLDAAVKNCEARGKETVARVAAAAEYAVSRLDAALERAHDSSGYDTAVAVRDAARSLSGGLAATGMEADALVAELDALAAAGGPLDDLDDPAWTPPLKTKRRCYPTPREVHGSDSTAREVAECDETAGGMAGMPGDL